MVSDSSSVKLYKIFNLYKWNFSAFKIFLWVSLGIASFKDILWIELFQASFELCHDYFPQKVHLL